MKRSAGAWVLACTLAMAGLAACGGGGGSGGGGSGGTPPPTGTNDQAIATASVAGTVSVVTGGSQALAITFTSSDGQALASLSVTSGLGSLPAGWSGPGTFTCASVTTGSGCALNLTYAPTAYGSGTLTVAYGYTNNAGTAMTGSVSIQYAATTNNNVVGITSPSAQVSVVTGGSQPMTVAFNTDDGYPASSLSVTTDLTQLPAGWSSSVKSFTCTSVGTGNGCLLSLAYSPAQTGTGTLTLQYSYTNDAGAPKTGTVAIGYTATAHDNVFGTASPAGQISVIAGGRQAVTVTFDTDDGKAASNLASTTDLASLPAGWSASGGTFSCAAVGNGATCQLPLTYAPTAAASGTLTLDFGYQDDSGTPKTGSVSIPYTSTAHDNVNATANPASISVSAGTSTPVTVTFVTDDGNAATGLSVTSDLTHLPYGWSSTSNTFSCASVSTGSGCQLALTYAPTSGASDTLTLAFAYTDNAGGAKSGSIGIAYQATGQHFYFTNTIGDSVEYCELQSGGIVANCKPTGSGFSFNQPFGITFHGSHAYVADYAAGNIVECAIDPQGTLSGCAATGGALANPIALTVSPGGTLGYVAQAQSTNLPVLLCSVSPTDGTLANCAAAGGSLPAAGMYDVQVSPDDKWAYMTAGTQATIYRCAIASDGTLSSCIATGPSLSGGGSQSNPAYTLAISADGNYLYATQDVAGGPGALICPISPTDGTLGTCQATASGAAAEKMLLNGSVAYLASVDANEIALCTINADGTIGGCSALPIATNGPWGMAIH